LPVRENLIEKYGEGIPVFYFGARYGGSYQYIVKEMVWFTKYDRIIVTYRTDKGSDFEIVFYGSKDFFKKLIESFHNRPEKKYNVPDLD